MTPFPKAPEDKTPEDLKAWIVERLDPIAGYDPNAEAPHSDFDLNPGMAPAEGGWSAAAVLVPLVEHETGLTVLLTRRADALRKHSGQIAFPGGRCDPGETPWEAALREAQEEIGLDPAQVSLAGLSSRYRTITGYDIVPVVGFVKPGAALRASPDEVADIFETPFSFLMDPVNHERRFYDLEDGLRRHYYSMFHDEREIWGATAGMLRALYERLYGPSEEPAVERPR